MYARVVRFTDVDPDHLAGRLDEVEVHEGPPVDIPAKLVQILHDPDQRTAVVIQLFETADDMSAAEGALDAMDPEDTPGTRASIDRCEIKAEVGPKSHVRSTTYCSASPRDQVRNGFQRRSSTGAGVGSMMERAPHIPGPRSWA